jgi:PKD repeat protein
VYENLFSGGIAYSFADVKVNLAGCIPERFEKTNLSKIQLNDLLTMKKTETTQLIRNVVVFLGIFSFVILTGCKKDEDVLDPIASFNYEIDATDYLKVKFENFSQNADSYSWAFGDGQTSTEANPTHTYAQAGNYNVVLTARNKNNVSHEFPQTIEIKDPNEALAKLAGQTSKTWKLYRVNTAMGVGPNEENPHQWWALANDGTRPCVYKHEFTFHRDGKFVFNDNGIFWGEEAVFGDPQKGKCFEATPANMKNKDGADVKAWLSGTHQFTFVPSTNMVTLTGTGAWMGLPQLTTTGDSPVPVASKSFRVTIEEFEGYDVMKVLYKFADLVWEFSYASYSDPALEPALVEVAAPWGEDLEDITPTSIFMTFASREASARATIDTISSISRVEFGVNDPADANAAKVGQFNRIAGEMYQELKFGASPEPKDIQFDNFTKAKIDIYIPANTQFAEDGLKKHIVFGFADQSQTREWWNSPTQFIVENNDVVVGEWKTYEFDLKDVKERKDLDMIFLGIGGGGHNAGGTFFIRNLIFE